MNEEGYIKGLLSNDKAVIAGIYKEFLPRIEAVVRKNSGSEEDAWEVFQEALILILKKARQPDFVLTCSFFTFLYGICRHLWSNELRKSRRKEVTIEDTNTFKSDSNIEITLHEEDRRNLFREKMKELGESCQQILKLFFTGKKFKEIASQLDLPSENAAKQQKFKCQRKLSGFIKSDPRYKELKNDT